MYTLGKMGYISHDEFPIKRAHEGVSVWTFSFSDFLRKFYKSLMHKCLRRFGAILKMSVFSYFLAFFRVNSQKYVLDYLGGECQALLCNIFTSVCVHKFSALAILGSPATIWLLKLNNSCFLELDND